MLDILVDSIEDENTRNVLRELIESLNQFPTLKGKWTFKEITVTSAVTNKKFAHGLGFRPKDCYPLSKTGSGTVTINYDSFDETYIDITTTAATTVRLVIGTYNEDL